MDLLLKQFRGRFVDDNQLPMTVVEDPYFDERIKMLEGEFHAQLKYLSLMETVRDNFGGNMQKFLEHRHSVKDQILSHILNSEGYKAMLADKSPLEDCKLVVGANELYTEQQDGGLFLSFDMIKANFQALRYVDPSIVRDCETWEEFVACFTDVKYLASAKQVRQEVLGKLNGKRLAAIEKYHSNEFGKEYKYRLGIYGFSPFSIKTDEIIFKFDGTEKEFESFHAGDQEYKGFKFRVNKFKLNMRTFKIAFSDKRINIFEKEDFLDGHRRNLKCVPATYYPQVYKLLNGMEISDSDLVFSSDHELCKYMKPLELVK
jgi:hypothetical protein